MNYILDKYTGDKMLIENLPFKIFSKMKVSNI